MTNNIFKTAVTAPTDAVSESHNETTGHSEVKVPFTDYEKTNGQPFLADHYGLGDRWQEIFPKEVNILSQFIGNKINKGEIADNQDAVKEELKKIEKITNMSKETRSVIKIGVLSSYVKFLMDTDEIKLNSRKYA